MENRKLKNFIIIALSILLILNVTILLTIVLRKNSKWYNGITCRKNKCFFDKYLELNDEQSLKFNEIRNKHKSTILPLLDSMHIVKNQIIDKLSNDSDFKKENYIELCKKIGELEAKVQLNTVEYFNEAKKILNEEQYKKFISRFRDISCGKYRFMKHRCKTNEFNN